MEKKETIINISPGSIIKGCIVVLSFYLIFFLKELVLVVLMSVVIASSVEPLTRWFVERKVPRLLGVIAIYLVIASILAFSVFFLLLPLLSESANVLNSLPSYFSNQDLYCTTTSDGFVSGLKNSLNMAEIATQINNFIDNLNLGAFNTIVAVFGGFLNFILMIVLSFYLSIDIGVHVHVLLEPKLPHGQGFSAATSMKSAGKTPTPFALATEIFLSSRGSLSASITRFSNSGNSSKNNTPLCERVISPGFG
jgi:hypothetical protein